MSKNDYFTILKKSFEQRYLTRTDVWTDESELAECALFLRTQLPSQKEMSILDIGTGRGRDTLFFLKQGYHVTGIDLELLPEWEEIQKEWKDKVCLMQTDFLNWNSDGKKFEGILDSGCFHHQHPSEHEKYLKKIAKILAPTGLGGLCVFTPEGHEQNKMGVQGFFTEIDGGRLSRYFTLTEIKILLENCGLVLKEYRTIKRKNFKRGYLFVIFTHGANNA